LTAAGARSRGWRYLRAFWDRAYRENITGLAGMVAYNLVLALFPFALLVLFIFGKVLQSTDVEMSVLDDLQRLFPAVEQALWIGTSFWGAMDTAFCRIYHVECRKWVEQKRFALVMLVGLTLFLAASVIIPTLEGLIVSSAEDLPFGLGDIRGLASALILVGALVITFLVTASIYYFVPKGHVPWRGVWPGSLFFTVTIGVANAVFPFYLTKVSNLDQVGGAIGFVLVTLLWFYLVSLGLMAGAVINALRYELHDTGALEVPGWSQERDAIAVEEADDLGF
jgi:membrane protein